MSVAESLIKGAEEALAIAKGELESADIQKYAEPNEVLVKGKEGRQVFTQKPCLMMCERKCLRVSNRN